MHDHTRMISFYKVTFSRSEENRNNRGTQQENFSIGVGTPFVRLSVLFVRFKGLFLNAKKNASVRIR